MRDGTFGTTADCPPLTDELVRRGRGPQLRAAGAALLAQQRPRFLRSSTRCSPACTAPPPGPGLVRGNDATDLETLAALAREPEIRDAGARAARAVRLLWEACQIPDFRKLADDTPYPAVRAACSAIWRSDGALPTDWLGRPDRRARPRRRRHRHADAAAVRRPGLVLHRRPHRLGARRRALAGAGARGRGPAVRRAARAADRPLRRPPRRPSDAPAGRRPTGEELLSAVTRRGEVVVEGHPVGHVDGFAFIPDPLADGRRARAGAARRPPGAARGDAAPGRRGWRRPRTPRSPGCRAQRHRLGGRAGRAAAARRDARCARWSRCWTASSSTAPQRERVRLRLQRFVDAAIAPRPGAAVRRRGGGRARRRRCAGRCIGWSRGWAWCAGATEADVPPALRGRLKALGVRAGRFALFMPALLKPRAAALRAALWALRARRAAAGLPAPGLVSLPRAGRLAGRVRRGAGLGRRRAGAAAAGRRRAGRRRTGLGQPRPPGCRAGRPRLAAVGARPSCCRRCCAASASGCCRRPPLPDGQFGPPAPADDGAAAPPPAGAGGAPPPPRAGDGPVRRAGRAAAVGAVSDA